MSNEGGGGGGYGCVGCLSIILFCFLVWALIFGITIGGKTYGVSCNRAKGVEIK